MNINQALNEAIKNKGSDLMEMLDDTFLNASDELLAEFYPELFDAPGWMHSSVIDATVEAYNTASQAMTRLLLTAMIDYCTTRDLPNPTPTQCGVQFRDEDDGTLLICDRPQGHLDRDYIGHQRGHDEAWLLSNNPRRK